ncbi:HTH-like domain-containing protein [Paenibacillus sp. FSL R5-0345]|uniref:HTH-like domain-containing protein n=1 Tax=Paenibacillus sp. FSL R5-0345 TaxID=1536770 RepID=UPI001E619997|nr:hypothetical protein [Paenibacillus sp. FSL R5-0345]
MVNSQSAGFIRSFIEIHLITEKLNGGFNLGVQELGRILCEMYNKAPHGKQVAKIHLFGVKYADIIRKNNYSVKDIVAASGINISYATEVSKGINLSEYVVPKE